MESQYSGEWHTRMLRSWHLALLRFAVTRDNADRLGVFTIANEMDGLGRQHDETPHFGYFRKTSTELYAAIIQKNDAARELLRQHLTKIDDLRLKRALAAALESGREARERGRSNRNVALWRGLATRGDVQH